MDQERRKKELAALAKKYIGKKHGYDYRRELRGIQYELRLELVCRSIGMTPQEIDEMMKRRADPQGGDERPTPPPDEMP